MRPVQPGEEATSRPRTGEKLPERCALTARRRDEDIAGTASTVRRFLLVEHDGPWGRMVPRDARLPGGVARALADRVNRVKARLLFIRRGERADAAVPGITVFAASVGPSGTVFERTTVPDLERVLDLDLAPLAEHRSLGLEPVHEAHYFVCTHGRHDPCCAIEGKPVHAALTGRENPLRERVWQVSHIGGDRFAANMLVLPHGLYLGRLTPHDVNAAALAIEAGRLSLTHLRGWSYRAMPVQYAEVALRRETGFTGLHDVLLQSTTREGAIWSSVFSCNASRVQVVVRSTPGEDPVQLTCGSPRPEPPLRHELLEISWDRSPTPHTEPPAE